MSKLQNSSAPTKPKSLITPGPIRSKPQESTSKQMNRLAISTNKKPPSPLIGIREFIGEHSGSSDEDNASSLAPTNSSAKPVANQTSVSETNRTPATQSATPTTSSNLSANTISTSSSSTQASSQAQIPSSLKASKSANSPAAPSLTKSAPPRVQQKPGAQTISPPAPPKRARPAPAASDSQLKSSLLPPTARPPPPQSLRAADAACAPAPKAPFLGSLHKSMEDPNLKVFEDDKVVVIRDAYPKAQHHMLVLPRGPYVVPTIGSLDRSHIELLRHVQSIADQLVRETPCRRGFRIGLHAVPSMTPLHVHVISQDLNSPFLKTKKHWNSFTTPYFIELSEVLRQIESNGSVLVDASAARAHLNDSLRCHVCSKGFATMPALKLHITEHL